MENDSSRIMLTTTWRWGATKDRMTKSRLINIIASNTPNVYVLNSAPTTT